MHAYTHTGEALGGPAPGLRGNHLSNATCLTQVFSQSGEYLAMYNDLKQYETIIT